MNWARLSQMTIYDYGKFGNEVYSLRSVREYWPQNVCMVERSTQPDSIVLTNTK